MRGNENVGFCCSGEIGVAVGDRMCLRWSYVARLEYLITRPIVYSCGDPNGFVLITDPKPFARRCNIASKCDQRLF